MLQCIPERDTSGKHPRKRKSKGIIELRVDSTVEFQPAFPIVIYIDESPTTELSKQPPAEVFNFYFHNILLDLIAKDTGLIKFSASFILLNMKI